MMVHEEWAELVGLSAAGELGDEEQRLLNEHMRSCPACRREHASLMKFSGLIEAHPPAAPDADLLREARQGLREALRAERTRPSLAGKFRELFRLPSVAWSAAGAGAIAVLVAGILIGRSWPGEEPGASGAAHPTSQTDGGDTRIANIRFINSDPATGEIEFAFEAVKPVRMKGSINDERIQRVLSHAIMNDQNAGVRLASISAVSSRGAAHDPEIKGALIAALQSDENPGVRAEALKALRGYPLDGDIKEAFLFVLMHDANPALRISAINCLDSVRTGGGALDQAMIDALRRTMETDNNNYIRLRAQTVMEEHRQ